MIEGCRPYLALFNPMWVKEGSGTIEIVESTEGGEGTASFQVSGSCIVVLASPSNPLLWCLCQTKCADGAIITFSDEGTVLHLVELKSKMTLKTWLKVMCQLEGMYLTAMALFPLLKLSAPVEVKCYLAANEDAITPAIEASPILNKHLVGSQQQLAGATSWSNGKVPLPHDITARLTCAWKVKGGVAAFGIIT